ncbi:hypothetical protein HYH02_006004, partial [Chlamydomonas schloesseri]
MPSSPSPATLAQVSTVLAHNIGRYLPQTELLAFRLVSKLWKELLPRERTHVDVPLSPITREGPSGVEAVPATFPQLKSLRLVSTSPPGSKSSSWPSAMPFWPISIAPLTQSSWPPIAAAHKQLTSLVVRLGPEQDTYPPSTDHTARCGVRMSALPAVAELRCLMRLELQLADRDWTDFGAEAQLRQLTGLTRLEELRLHNGAILTELAHELLRGLPQLRQASLTLAEEAKDAVTYSRKDLALWRRLHGLQLRLQARHLEADAKLLQLGLAPGSLRALHLRSCTVTPYSLSALSCLGGLTELSFDAWSVAAPAAAAAGRRESGQMQQAAAVRSALTGLLGGPLGRQLQVLRMDVAGGGRDIYEELPSLAASWGRLRTLHLVGAAAFRLSAAGALAGLSGLTCLRELRVAVQGAACADGSCLRAAWLPPHLTSLELAGVHLPCGELEAEAERKQLGTGSRGAHRASGAGGSGTAVAGEAVGHLAHRRRSQVRWKDLEEGPLEGSRAAAQGVGSRRDSGAGAVKRRASEPGSGEEAGPSQAATACGCGCLGHSRLASLERLSLHYCRFGCCDHMQAALGAAVLPRLASLELREVVGLTEEHLTGLAGLTQLRSLSVCAMNNSGIGSASMGVVSGLTGLTRLQWHAGDSLDMSVDPVVLKGLQRLAVLHVSNGQYWRMSRWHVNSALMVLMERRLHWMPPVRNATAAPEFFSEERAWAHMQALAGDLPDRQISMPQLRLAHDYVEAQGRLLQQLAAARGGDVEVQVYRENVTGSVAMDFGGVAFTNAYNSLTNIIVTITPAGTAGRPGLLIASHHDSAVASPGASDDVAMVAVMLEAARALLSRPPASLPAVPLAAVLFDGGEESICQAGHGFFNASAHARGLGAFINLEAMGAGGLPILFQHTGAWTVAAWAAARPTHTGRASRRSASHRRLQDIFDTGLIPGDTDYRMFSARHFGSLPGLDIAFIRDSVAYHSSLDSVDRVRRGSLQ